MPKNVNNDSEETFLSAYLKEVTKDDVMNVICKFESEHIFKEYCLKDIK